MTAVEYLNVRADILIRAGRMLSRFDAEHGRCGPGSDCRETRRGLVEYLIDAADEYERHRDAVGLLPMPLEVGRLS